MMKALLDSETGNFPEAIQRLEIGHLEHPHDHYLLKALGDVYGTMGDWRTALSTYKKAFQLDHLGLSNLHMSIGEAYYNLDDFSSAITELKFGLENSPGYPKGRWFLARCYHKTGRLHEAFNEYKILLNSYQGEMLAITHNMIADLYRTKGQVDDAIIELKKGLAISPNMGEAHDWLGKCYEEKGLMDEAKSEYQIAKKLGYNESET